MIMNHKVRPSRLRFRILTLPELIAVTGIAKSKIIQVARHPGKQSRVLVNPQSFQIRKIRLRLSFESFAIGAVYR